MPLIGSLVDWTRLKKNPSELKDMKIEIFKTKNQREQRLKKHITQYPRTMEQLQKV